MYKLSMKDEVELQMSFIMSDDNGWYAKKHYIEHHGYDKDRALTSDELCLYWVECGAAKWFRDVFLKELPLVVSDDNIWYAKAYYVKCCGYPQSCILTLMELYKYWMLCGAASWFRSVCLGEDSQNQRSA